MLSVCLLPKNWERSQLPLDRLNQMALKALSRVVVRYQGGKRLGAHQRVYLLKIIDAKMIGCVVCTENLIRVDDVMESPKPAE